MNAYLPDTGDNVRWSHTDRRGTLNFTGTVLEKTATLKSGYQRVRRADTKKVVIIRTWALSKIPTK